MQVQLKLQTKLKNQRW